MTCDQAAGLKCATLPNFYAKSINRAACYRDKDKCNTGERQMICIDYNNSSISGYQKCYKSTNGELYFDWDLNAATICRNADKLPTSCANATQCGDAIIVDTCQSFGDKCTADLGYSGCAHFADLGAACYTQTCTPETSTPFVCDAYTSNDSSFNASQQCLAASDGKYYRIDIALCDDACAPKAHSFHAPNKYAPKAHFYRNAPRNCAPKAHSFHAHHTCAPKAHIFRDTPICFCYDNQGFESTFE